MGTGADWSLPRYRRGAARHSLAALCGGAYLPIGTTLPIFAGGLVRLLVDLAASAAGTDADAESEISPGSLYASGLIAAGGIVGLFGVALKAYEATMGKGDILNFPHTFLDHDACRSWPSRCWRIRCSTLRGSRLRNNPPGISRQLPIAPSSGALWEEVRHCDVDEPAFMMYDE